MRQFLYCNRGYYETAELRPNCWINVECPTADDAAFLTKELGVPEDFLNDISDIDERPHIEIEGKWMFVVMRIPLRDVTHRIPFTTVPLGLIIREDIVISVCNHRTEMMPDFIAHSQRKELQINTPYDLVLRLMFSSAVWFLKYLKVIYNSVTATQDSLEKSVKNEELLALMNYEKCLVYFNTSIRGNEVMLSKLKNSVRNPNLLDKDLMEDVEIELKQAHDMVNVYSDILSGTMDAFASVISNNVNVIMKRMTSLSIILMVPTLIASFYGMNVNIGLDNVPYAFLLILLLSATLSAGAFFIFRKIHWF